VLRGKDEISEMLRDVCERAMTHHVEDEVIGEGRIAYNEACEYPDGNQGSRCDYAGVAGGQDRSPDDRRSLGRVGEHTLSEFAFAAFKRAFEDKDFDSWVAFYADDAEWIEYRHFSPPRSPDRMVGRQQIAEFLERICGANLGITIADEVIGPDRVAFSVDCTLPDGKHIFEHVIAHFENGKISRQVDVEASDE
jgi:ketosteroid isomerase-like protein